MAKKKILDFAAKIIGRSFDGWLFDEYERLLAAWRIKSERKRRAMAEVLNLGNIRPRR